jgi:hypothetical protein
VRQGGSTIVLQWTEQWIGIDLVSRSIQKPTAVVAANVVAVRRNRALIVVDVFA